MEAELLGSYLRMLPYGNFRVTSFFAIAGVGEAGAQG